MTTDTLLERLLDGAHSAVMAANYSALAGLGQELETELARFDPGADAKLLRRIGRKAERNAACLLAAGRGIRSAVRRLEDVRQAAKGLVTYDGNGRRSESGGTGQIIQRL